MNRTVVAGGRTTAGCGTGGVGRTIGGGGGDKGETSVLWLVDAVYLAVVFDSTCDSLVVLEAGTKGDVVVVDVGRSR